jgi:hypothetical protein
MNAEDRKYTLAEAAAAVALDVTVVRRYAELGLITSAHGYSEIELAELRRVRRLMEDLELDHGAIEIVLRMRRRVLMLQAEVRRLEVELRDARRLLAPDWIEGDWRDL